MKISARNILKGRVAKIVQGAVNCEVTLEVAPGVEVVSSSPKHDVVVKIKEVEPRLYILANCAEFPFCKTQSPGRRSTYSLSINAPAVD